MYPASLSTWTGIYTVTSTPTTIPLSSSTILETPTLASVTKTTVLITTPATHTHSSVCVDSTNSILYDCFTTAPPSISSTTTPTTTTSSTATTPTATTAYKPTTTVPTTTTHNQLPTPALTTSTTSPTTSSNNPNPLNGGYAGAEVSYLSGGPGGQREGSRAGSRAGSRVLWCVGIAIVVILWERYGGALIMPPLILVGERE